MPPIIEVNKLSKVYRVPKKQPGVIGTLKSLVSRDANEVKAVHDVSFTVEPGELVGFLGPNGAGKTTTLKMLTGILIPTAGEAKVLGYTPFDRPHDLLRQLTLVMGNKAQLWWDLPAYDGFLVLREVYEVDHAVFKERLDFLVDALDVGDKISTQLRKLSLGERMKCELIASMLHNPKLAFLDEPTLGLDVVSQKRIRLFLKDLNEKEGTTMILTSHYMQDVEELCERVILIDHGTLKFDGPLSKLLETYSDIRRIKLTFGTEVHEADRSQYPGHLESDGFSATYEVKRSETASLAGAVLAALPVVDIAIDEVPIEEVIRKMFTREPSA